MIYLTGVPFKIVNLSNVVLHLPNNPLHTTMMTLWSLTQPIYTIEVLALGSQLQLNLSMPPESKVFSLSLFKDQSEPTDVQCAVKAVQDRTSL